MNAWEIVRLTRGIILLGISLTLLYFAMLTVFAQSREYHSLENEHRFTTVEVQIVNMQSDINALRAEIHDLVEKQERGRPVGFVEMLALAGLIGERSYQVLRKGRE